MATKLKNNKNNKYIVSIIAIITILIASVGMVLTYPMIKKDSRKFITNPFEFNNWFEADISESTYGLYYKIKSENSSEPIRPVDLMLEVGNPSGSPHKDNQMIVDENIGEETNRDEYKYEVGTKPTEITPYTQQVMDNNDYFDENIYSYIENFEINLKNLKYYVVDKENNKVIKNSDLDGKAILENNKSVIDKINEDYRFYVVMDFDELGNLRVGKVHGANKEEITRSVQLDGGYNLGIYEAVNGFKLKKIKNMTYIYAVPENLTHQDKISDYIKSEEWYGYQSASYMYISIALIFVAIIALLIPYKELENLFGFKKIIKIPIEMIIALVATAIIFIYGSAELIIVNTINNELINFTQLQLNKEVTSIITYIINIIYWAICFTVIFIGFIMIKHIFKVGILNYLKNNSLIINIFKYITKKTKKLYKWCTSFELSKNNNKKVVVILAINMIILSAMCLMWMFGLIIVPIYTLILAIVIRKNYEKIVNDYNKLLNITKEISTGNLETNTSEDVGVFNVLKDELTNIQSGFKKAVDEEVKSQKMKTELISNVSHDLKTPLTSIITYVDLLKDENLEEEKRKLYIDTLDRKSERLKVLIEDLFEVSKATSGNVNLNIMDVDVVSLMKQTLLEVDDKFKAMNLIVRKNLPDEKTMLKLDSQRTFRVFENLLVNITKYAMYGSRVYIDIIDREDIVEVSLRNMAADEINFNVDELVERFVRGDKSRNTDGSGLGLAIAKSFVELQGGEFEVSVDGDLFKVVIKFKK